jgi:glycosyltransferase involved in cell wall biosynthesis
LCGQGPQRAELEALTHKLGIYKDVFFTGYLPAASVWALIKKSSVFVSLSTYEGCPNTVMEAMVCGSPIVVTDIPGHREILDEASTLFVSSFNSQHVADKIIQALSDLNASQKRVSVAQEKTKQWDISEVAEKWERVYLKSVPHYKGNTKLL